MANPERERFIPPRLGQRDHARAFLIPRWFLREAVMTFELNPYDIAAFVTIADGLDSAGISKTAITLIADRGGMSKGGAARSVDRLLSMELIHELDPRMKGRIMRYTVPLELPWAPI